MKKAAERRQWVKLVVYILLRKEGRILLGKRKGAFGAGFYAMPAGHIEREESVLNCAKRELLEETGIRASNFHFQCVRLLKPYEVEGVKADPYVAFCVKADGWQGEPKTMEPGRVHTWEWHEQDRLPEPMFPPVKMLMECLKTSSSYMD